MRTPEARFASLPGFPDPQRYQEWRGLRARYVEQGEGARVVAPDFIGSWRSDKPTEESFYTFDMHRSFLLDFIAGLDLTRITLVVQDWGGLPGLTLPMEMPERFERLLVMNTALGTGDAPLSEGFVAWRAYVNKTPDLPCGKLMQRTCPHLAAEEAAAYDAPFPDFASKAVARAFPNLVPDRPDAQGAAISRKARDWWMSSWKGESFIAAGATDPVLGPPVMNALRKSIRDCPEPTRTPRAGISCRSGARTSPERC